VQNTVVSPAIDGRPASRAWHAALTAIVLASLVLQVALVVRGEDLDPALPNGLSDRLIRLFSYFTIQSSIVVLAGVATLALRRAPDGALWRVVRLDGLVGIVVTGLVFVTVLAATTHPTGAAWWANAGLHYVSPTATLLGWLLFGPRPRITWSTVGWALVWPVGWLGYTFAHGAVSHWYPYPFLDVTALGYVRALANTGAVVLLAFGLLTLARWLDGRLPASTAVPEALKTLEARQVS